MREDRHDAPPGPAVLAAVVAAVAACLGVEPERVHLRRAVAVPVPPGAGGGEAAPPWGYPRLWALAGRLAQMGARRQAARPGRAGPR